jgi:hypothetical protein
MRRRRRQVWGIPAAALALLAALAAVLIGPAAAAVPASPSHRADPAAAPGIATGVPVLSPFQKPFIAPQPRPTETRGRPTDSPDPNRNAYSVPQAPESPKCSPHFCVHWVAIGLDAPELTDSNGDGVPDYVEKVLKVAEHVHQVENDQLGWREPMSDGHLGGADGKTDIYLSQIGGELFGYAAPDQGQGPKNGHTPRRLHGYLVLDNDYSAFEFPGTKPTLDLEVTLAHEYNHILQFGYDAYQDPWFAESTAVWMEDQVYNDIDDYLRYVRRWVHYDSTPLTESSIKEYGTAVWNQWLARRYGRAIIRKAWADAIHTKPAGFSVNAYEAAIRAAGPSDFGHDFSRFAAAVAEWRTNTGFREAYLYPDMPRQGRLQLGAAPITRHLNHTTFELLRVRAPGGKAAVVRAMAPEGVASGLALIGRIGSEKGGRTVVRLDYSQRGGKLTARLPRPGRFDRVTAVVVNADASEGGFSARHLDWRYLTDRLPYEISGRIVR